MSFSLFYITKENNFILLYNSTNFLTYKNRDTLRISKDNNKVLILILISFFIMIV